MAAQLTMPAPGGTNSTAGKMPRAAATMGTPGGASGISTRAMATPQAAATRPWRVRRWGIGEGQVAGGEGGVEAPHLGVADGVAGHRPQQRPGVPEGEHGHTGQPERLLRRARRPSWAVAMAVDSSITSWAATTRRPAAPAKVGAMATP